ncbi:MAG TPA: phosphatase domain-containing protein [Lentimicrobium sp.]|nr:phosphatase domain-containing protein [Lentimicrobium sp.]
MKNKRTDKLEHQFDSSKGSILKRKSGWLGSPKIIPYIGYGDNNNTFIMGEVVRSFAVTKPAEHFSRWQNILATVKRYLVEDVADFDVTVEYNGMSKTVRTDKFGIFRCEFNHSGKLISAERWQKAIINLTINENNRYYYPDINSGKVESEVMVVNNKSQFGVISDIDDTIIVSYATQKLTKLKLLLFNNAHTRMPFEGVSAFYTALQQGTSDDITNPVFYLSNSEWNLYDLLYEFIEFNRIPKGPLLLREMKIRLLNPLKLMVVKKNHKQQVLYQLFSTLTELKFILIGDSGQHDPEVYAEIVRQFPGRVLAIYIRDVGIPEHAAEIETISQKIQDEFSVEMILVKDTEAAAKHAISKGFISPEYLKPIIKEKEKDQQASDTINPGSTLQG